MCSASEGDLSPHKMRHERLLSAMLEAGQEVICGLDMMSHVQCSLCTNEAVGLMSRTANRKEEEKVEVRCYEKQEIDFTGKRMNQCYNLGLPSF